MFDDETPTRGCLNQLVRQILLAIIGLLMIVLTVLNLQYSSVLVETCGNVHPVLFEFSIEVVELSEDALNTPFGDKALPVTPPPEDIDDSLFAINWESCLEYYGYADSNGNFQMNAFGQEAFFQSEFTMDGESFHFGVEPRVSETDVTSITWVMVDYDYPEDGEYPVKVESEVALSTRGIMILYMILPSLVIVLPIFTVILLRISRDTLWWLAMIVLIAAQSLTASLLYIQLASISGISTLEEFGIGIFTGVITGTALAFMSKVLDNFSETNL